jgi:hypothetical protein
VALRFQGIKVLLSPAGINEKIIAMQTNKKMTDDKNKNKDKSFLLDM